MFPKLLGRRSERSQRVHLVLFDIKHSVQLGDRKHLVNLGPDVAELQLAAVRLDLLIQHDQPIQCCTRQELDVREIEQQLVPLFLLDQLEEVFAQLLNQSNP